MNMFKPVVRYHDVGDPIVVGGIASIFPVDHPREYLNGELALTSTVLSVDDVTGDFETKNTKYVRVEK